MINSRFFRWSALVPVATVQALLFGYSHAAAQSDQQPPTVESPTKSPAKEDTKQDTKQDSEEHQAAHKTRLDAIREELLTLNNATPIETAVPNVLGPEWSGVFLAGDGVLLLG